jgi:hypothetical protein
LKLIRILPALERASRRMRWVELVSLILRDAGYAGSSGMRKTRYRA